MVSTSSLFVLAALLPHVVVVALAPLLLRIGLHSLLRGLFSLKVTLSVVFYLWWGDAPLALAAFLMLNKIMTETICRHGNLVVAELVDEGSARVKRGAVVERTDACLPDMALHRRVESRSSLLYGAAALFSKPGQATAAMVGWFIFRDNGDAAALRATDLAGPVLLVPALCGAAQLLLWQMYRPRRDGDGSGRRVGNAKDV